MNARQAIYDWSQTLPSWRQDLLRRVAAHEASDGDGAEVFDLLLKENGLAPAAPAPVALQLADLPEDVPSATQILLEIGECSNVNAIDSEEPLTFEPSHITLIYGENGTGKSGYSRVVKRVARAAHEETVLANVFSGTPSGPPRAVIKVEDESGQQTKHIVPLDRAQPVLSSMTVFDAQCATVYLRNAKTVEFTPTPLRVFVRAASAQRKIRDILDARIKTMQEQQPSFEDFPAGTQVRSILDSLGSTVSEQQLHELANVSEGEGTEFGKLKLELASAEAGTAGAQARQRERDAKEFEALATQLAKIDSALSAEQEDRLRRARQRVKEAEHALSVARKAAFAEEPLSPTGGEGWRVMWEAARAFVEKDCRHGFPPTEDGGICPFCQQTLSADARARLDRFEAFVKRTVSRELSSAQDALTELERLQPSQQIDFAQGSPALKTLDDEDSELATTVREWLEAAGQRTITLTEGHEKTTALEGCPSATLNELAARRNREAVRQKQATDPARRQELRQAVAELEARGKLGERLAEVITWHTTVKTVEALQSVRGQLDTSSLSHKQSELAKVLVTGELRRAVTNELDSLGFPQLNVGLDCRTERGETVARMTLDGATEPVSAVLSDGEQRACALAFFLAESLASPSKGGIVFDDPASSLDIERIEHIGGRLVDLAEKRTQIIVFTHNLPFAWFLQDAAEKAGVAFSVRRLSRLGERAGIVRTGKSWPGEKLGDRLVHLRETLKTLETLSQQGNIEAYEPAAKAFAGDLRETWERAVEEGLFKKVVMRFQRDVKALHIKDVAVTADLTKEVFDGMTETSPYHHSSALAKPTPTPSIEDLRKFFARVEEFCKVVKQKQGSAAKEKSAAQRRTGQQSVA
ncbi:MAG: AAA family ATPase [Actinomycetota bacterium]|nr:AAA family ATPase [Actinomycetota bacterium]